MDNQQNDNSDQNTQQSPPEPGGCKCQIDKEAILALLKSVWQRGLAVVLKPAETWQTIKTETTSIVEIYKNYLCVLAAIPVICGFIGGLIIGAPFFGSLVGQIVAYAIMLVGVYICAIVLEKLAPKFEGSTDALSAFKLVGYSLTAPLAAGVLLLVPNPLFGLLVFLALLYGLYILYLGIPVLTSVPEQKRMAYLGVAIAAIFVIFLIVVLLKGAVVGCKPHPLPGPTSMLYNHLLRA